MIVGRSADASIRRHIIVGAAVGLFLVCGLGGWAATTDISGAVVAQGQLVVDSNVKKVQHPTGGVVGEILVRDGSRVNTGDVLVRLDETVTRANLAIVVKSLDELAARLARLETERDDKEELEFPESLLSRQADPDVSRIIFSEQKLFELRKSARQGQKGQLKEKLAQLHEEIVGLTGQAESKKKESEFVGRELDGIRELWKKQFTTISRLMALERDAEKVNGERNQLISAAAQTRGKIAETELQLIQVDQDLRSEVAKELREIQGKTAELVERRVAAEDQLKRIDIRAPQDGIVHELSVHTVGGVISPSEQLMLVVPGGDELTVEVKVSPRDIDQLRVGQTALLRIESFNLRTTPELNGIVSVISADIAQDPKTQATYYLVRISMSAKEIDRLKGLRLVPGMPVEAFIQTNDRTVISFLVKPLHDQIMRAFRER